MALKFLLTTQLLFLAFETLHVSGQYECCPGPNILFMSNRSCSIENIQQINLDCPVKIATNRSQLDKFNYNILENGSIIDIDSNRVIRYCHSTNGDESNSSTPIFIICVEQTSEDHFDNDKLTVQAILGFISTAFVILTLIAYSIVPNMLDLQGICIMHTLGGLASGYTFLGIIQIVPFYDYTACKVFAYLVYFSFQYLFFWLVTLSFHIWRITVKPQLSSGAVQWPLAYHLFGIGGPVCSVIIVLAAHYSPAPMWENIRPGFGENKCWFKSDREIWIYFYGPLIVLLLCNVLFYLWTVISLWKQVESNHNKILKYRLKLCLRLFIIMGITWIFEILTFILKPHMRTISGKILLSIVDLLNILQGILIFLVLVVLRKKFRRAFANKNPCRLPLPNSWKFLEDEEMDTAEQMANETVVEYKNDNENNVEVNR